MVRCASAADFEALVGLARRFTAESGLPVSFDEDRARQTLWRAIHSPEVAVLVDDIDGVIGGGAIMTFEAEWTREVCAYVVKFYVERELRGLGSARALVAGLMAEARARSATLMFASATAGLGERVERLYVRLFERAGFNVLGRIVMKEL